MTHKTTLTTFLWFQKDLEEALDFYSAIFKDVVIHSKNRMGDEGPLFTSDFSILGHEFIGLNWGGGPEFNDSISLLISCDGQGEVDYYWDALSHDGKPGQCGWLKDRYGLSWQVTPRQMRDYLGDPDPAKAEYAMQALRKMGKIVLRDFYE